MSLPPFRIGNIIQPLGSDEKWIVANVTDACCEHGEGEHETVDYRGPKERACLHAGCRCQRFRHGHVEAISFDSQNVSAGQRLDDHVVKRTCWADDNSGNICDDPDCETCHGTGSYEEIVKGWKRSKVVATSVKDFILQGVKKTWGL